MNIFRRWKLRSLVSASRIPEAISYLRSLGLSKGESAITLAQAGMEQGAAKLAVHESPAWRDRHEADTAFHESLERGVDEIQRGGEPKGTAHLDVLLPPDGGAGPYLQLFDPEKKSWYGIDDEWWDGPARRSPGRFEQGQLAFGRYRWRDHWTGITSESFDIDGRHLQASTSLDLRSVAVVRGWVLLPPGCPGSGICVYRFGDLEGMLLSPCCPKEFGDGSCAVDGSFSVRIPGVLPVRLRVAGWAVDPDGPRTEVEVVGARDGVTLAPPIDATKAWSVHLSRSVSALEPVFLKHVHANGPSLLPHVFFGDVTRFVVGGFSDKPTQRSDSEKILALLEEAMGSPDEAVQNLVSVSFCENLMGEKPLEAIRAAMGPKLRAELSKYEGA